MNETMNGPYFVHCMHGIFSSFCTKLFFSTSTTFRTTKRTNFLNRRVKIEQTSAYRDDRQKKFIHVV